jgi:hypothetical protein
MDGTKEVTMAPYTDTVAQQMLCLAALTYREFADVGPPELHEQRLHDDVTAKLAGLPVLQKKWTLAWGPASYRAPLSLFDGAAMFVAKAAGADRYVVAVRGTNPICAFDWLFGDLWVAGKMPWPFDATRAAQISLSTALGLDILLQLRSSTRPAGGAAAAWSHLAKNLGNFAAGLKDKLLRPLEDVTITPLRDTIAKSLSELASHRVTFPAQDLATRTAALHAEWLDPARLRLLATIAEALGKLGGDPSLHVLALLERDAQVASRLASGDDLLTFLTAAVASAKGPVEIVVTGHSKGGALAPTLALWLHETRGKAADATYRWDPENRATVSCYAYAGPTAGNAAFAERSNGMIGDRCRRIHNKLDVVPHAWVPNDLRAIGTTLYEAPVMPVPGLAALASDLANVVTQQGVGYTQIGNDDQELPGVIDTTKTDFALQMVHQHLQGYLDQMGLGGQLTVDTFFNPLH